MNVSLISHPLPEFWERYDAVPENIQEQADKRYAVFEQDPFHPSLRFKETDPYWVGTYQPRLPRSGAMPW